MGWNPPEKRKELFNPLARFLLVAPVDNPDVVAAYCTFRFEFEEEEDLVYWSVQSFKAVFLSWITLPSYEIQTNRLHQRKGIGKFLVNSLEAIGRKFCMGKIMLTVFNSKST